jgi:translation initiation factor IF-1
MALANSCIGEAARARVVLINAPRKRDEMSSDDAIEFEGKVVEVLSGGTFKVNVGEGHDVIAKLAGKMRRYRIRVVLGDRVTVAVSPYDPTRGRITYRPR